MKSSRNLLPDGWISEYSDLQLVDLIKGSPTLEHHRGIMILSDRYLAKSYRPDLVDDVIEAVKVAENLKIRVPQVVRTVRSGHFVYVIMERIWGHTLEDAWISIGWFATFRLAWTLRCYIQRMRSINSTGAGSLVSGACRSFWLLDVFGLPPRAAYQDISAFLAFWFDFRSIRQEFRKRVHRTSSLGGRAGLYNKLVFTHHDLAPRNMIVDASGDVWLIDWDFAGFYPIYFEYAAMHNFTMPRSWGVFSRFRWYLLTWIAAGRFAAESQLLETIRSRFTRFSAGRLRNIRAGATKMQRTALPDSANSSDACTYD